MQSPDDKARSSRSKKIALVFGLIAIAWYVISILTILH